jgi:hypothetical protein
VSDLLAQFAADINEQPQWISWWLNVLGPAALITCVLFLFRRNLIPAAILIFLAFPSTLLLYSYFGYSRVLGLGHITFWTPAAIYLWRIRPTWRVRDTWLGKWIVFILTIMLISLAFDYVDLARWLMGDKG